MTRPQKSGKSVQHTGKHNHEITTADNGADGVWWARAEQPDLVLMDVVMPGLNGFPGNATVDASTGNFFILSSLSLPKIRKPIVFKTRQGPKDIWSNRSK